MSKIAFLQDWIPGLADLDWAPAFLKREHANGFEELTELMLASDGEYSSLLLAEQLLEKYESADDAERLALFLHLTQSLDLDDVELNEAANAYSQNPDAGNLRRLNRSVHSPRRRVLQQINQVPSGTEKLVAMRETVIRWQREHPEIRKLDIELLNLFKSWFNQGFLELREIDWTTPAHILEKIIAYEAVHAIDSWRELRARLAPKDRLCFAFFHPCMKDEPLVFVEVALTLEQPNKIEAILGNDREQIEPSQANCAIFYSISNCHKGLAGVSFGNFLIKHVVSSLQRRFPHLKEFATLSPVPGLRAWCDSKTESTETSAELALETLAAQYFLSAKSHDGFPLDPVARFHLRNGAYLARINPGADMSVKGHHQSHGLMVNYVYDLQKIAENHENYVAHKRVSCHPSIAKLATQ